MIESLAPLWMIVGLFGGAALLLWLLEGVAKLIGGRTTWMLFLVVVPLAVSVALSLSNWERLVWWERILYPLSGPVGVAALLFFGFAALNPADAILVVLGLGRRVWRFVRGQKGAQAE